MRWSVWGSTYSCFADKSQALHREAALSAAITSSPGGNGAFFCINTTATFVALPCKLFL